MTQRLLSALALLPLIACEVAAQSDIQIRSPNQILGAGRVTSLTSGSNTMTGEQAMELRVSRIEEMLGRQKAADLLLQIQQLQQEVQDLRGIVELMQHKMGGPAAFASLSRSLEASAPTELKDPDAILEGRPSAAAIAAAQGRNGGPPPGLAAAGTPNLPSLPTPETQKGNERDAYRAAFELLKARNYRGAQTAFRDLLERFPRGQYADNARYWIGETSYIEKDFPGALNEFGLLIEQYPLSPKVPNAMLKIGYIHYEQQGWQDARRTLQTVTERYPDTTEARLAKGRLERMSREGH